MYLSPTNYQPNVMNFKFVSFHANPLEEKVVKTASKNLKEFGEKALITTGISSAAVGIASINMQNNNESTETPISSVINVEKLSYMERINSENLKKTFNKILTEIESKPEIINFIKDNPEETEFVEDCTLNNVERVRYIFKKNDDGNIHITVYLYPNYSKTSYDNMVVGEINMLYDTDGNSIGGWHYNTIGGGRRRSYKRSYWMSYEYIDNKNNITDAYKSPIFNK